MSFEFTPLKIGDVRLVETKVFKDRRGHLIETFDRNVFDDAGLMNDVVLEFQSRSTTNALRGLHFQREPYAQAKLVRCLVGEIFDVAVDIRPKSPTFGEYVSRRLSDTNKDALFIPEGFAHGFLTLSEYAVVDYKITAEYAPEYEAGIAWDDSGIDVDWPLDSSPVLSEKDAQWPELAEIDESALFE